MERPRPSARNRTRPPRASATTAGTRSCTRLEDVRHLLGSAGHYHGDWQKSSTPSSNAGAKTARSATYSAVAGQYTDKSNVPGALPDRLPWRMHRHQRVPKNGCIDLSARQSLLTEACRLPDRQQCAGRAPALHRPARPAQRGMGAIYYLLTPPGVTVCLERRAPPTARTSAASEAEAEKEEKTVKKNQELQKTASAAITRQINPSGLPTGEANTVLYAAIPWIAGGLGDYHLAPPTRNRRLRMPGRRLRPVHKPIEETGETEDANGSRKKRRIRKKERRRKTEAEEAEEREGPRQQEPNQVPIGPDGSLDTGLADLIVNQIAVEQQNIVTDPLLNAWQDSARNEATDECRNFFATGQRAGASPRPRNTEAGTLYNEKLRRSHVLPEQRLQPRSAAAPLSGRSCLGGVALVPQFTAPNAVNAGEVVGFDGMESTSPERRVRASRGRRRTATTHLHLELRGRHTDRQRLRPRRAAVRNPWLTPCAASVLPLLPVRRQLRSHAHRHRRGRQTRPHNTRSPSSARCRPPRRPPARARPQERRGGAAAGASHPRRRRGARPRPACRTRSPRAVLSHTLRSACQGGLVVRYSVNEQVGGPLRSAAPPDARRAGSASPAPPPRACRRHRAAGRGRAKRSS